MFALPSVIPFLMRCAILAGAALSLACWGRAHAAEPVARTATSVRTPPVPTEPPPFLKGVTYFGRAWPVNFWNSDLSQSKRDFQAIKADGFNTVVMVVPWSEFQPGLDPIRYDDALFSRLREVCEAANGEQLKVFLRVSYLWDFGANEQKPAVERANALMTGDGLQVAWQDYLREVGDATRGCASGYFLSWEDYWHVLDATTGPVTDDKAVEVSRKLGFDAWAREHASKAFRETHADVFGKYGAYPIPAKASPDFREIYAWFDDQLSHRLLDRAAKVLPNISIEARVDGDPVYKDGSIVEWYSHAQTYDVKSAPYLMTYWAPAMGAKNEGERDSAEAVIDRFVYIHKNILKSTGNRLFVEQFLYTDNTPKMRHNATIDPAQMKDFLLGMSAPLLQFTSGYALWGYQNYRASVIYNGFFSLGLTGWKVSGDVTLSNSADGVMAKFGKDSSLSQYLPAERDHYRTESDDLQLRITAEGKGTVDVGVGQSKVSLAVAGPSREYVAVLKHAGMENDVVIHSVSGGVAVTAVYLYRFVQASSVRDDEGKPLPDLDSMRELNRRLDALDGLPSGYSVSRGNLARVIGVYDVERDGDHSFAWAGPKVVAYLHASKPFVSVSGRLSVSMFKDQSACRVDGYVDDVNAGSVQFNRDGMFLLHLPILRDAKSSPTKVELRSSCQTRPVAGKGDQRVLSYVIDAIES